MRETREIHVPTINCEGCAETITTVVKSLAGVRDIVVDVRRKAVKVTFDPSATNLDAIQSQIRMAGF